MKQILPQVSKRTIMLIWEEKTMFHGSFHLHTLVISTVVETEVMSLNALKSRGLEGLPCRIYENTPFKKNTRYCAYS